MTQIKIDCNSNTDYIQLLKEIAQTYKDKKDITITFEKGIYNFYDLNAVEDFTNLMSSKLDYDTHWGKGNIGFNKAIVFEQIEGLTISGNDSKFIFDGLISPFTFKNCNHTAIEGISIDWTRPPFTIATVESVDGNTTKVEVHKDFPMSGGEPIWALMDYDSIEQRFGKIWKFRNMSTIRRVNEKYFEFDAVLQEPLKKGSKVVLRHVGNYRPCIHIFECNDTYINNINIYNNPGMGIVAHYSKNIRIRNLKVMPKKDHIMSTTTDATHFINCEGLLDFENCYFEGMGDDAINVHGFYNYITKIIDDYRVEVTILNENGTQDQIFDIPKTGDEVEFSKVCDLKPFAENNKVVDFKVDNSNWTAILKFKNPISPDIKIGDLLTKTNDVASLRFVNCRVKSIRARACLIQTRNVLIENCFFENCTGTAVHIDTATFWWESVRCKNIAIRNNVMKGCGYGDGTYLNACGVAVLTESEKDAVSVHENIIIENNTIIGNSKNVAIAVKNTDDCFIRNNFIRDCEKAIVVESSTNIEVENNDIQNQKIIFNR
jgi:parallel beta-helix repeat protein